MRQSRMVEVLEIQSGGIRPSCVSYGVRWDEIEVVVERNMWGSLEQEAAEMSLLDVGD